MYSQLLKKKNFLFDLDGTLVQSSSVHESAYIAALEKLAPQHLSRFDYQKILGVPTILAFKSLANLSDQEVEALVQEKQKNYREAVTRGEVKVFPAVIELMNRLRDFKKRSFIVTGASRRSTIQILTKANLLTYFEGIITADEVPNGKPAPDIFLHTLKKYSLDACESVTIEDSYNGKIASSAAGVETILVNGSGGVSIGEFTNNLFADEGASFH